MDWRSYDTGDYAAGGAAGMNGEYRFLLLNGAGAVLQEIDMVCLDDEAALLLGERFAIQNPVQVWSDGRYVGDIQPQPSGAKSAPAVSEAKPAEPAKRFKPFWSGGWRRGASPN
jgi:hypothetical protein